MSYFLFLHNFLNFWSQIKNLVSRITYATRAVHFWVFLSPSTRSGVPLGAIYTSQRPKLIKNWSKTVQKRSKPQSHCNFITIWICKLHRNTSKCTDIQSEMFLYYLEHVSKVFCDQYTMKNANGSKFLDFGANREARLEPAL